MNVTKGLVKAIREQFQARVCDFGFVKKGRDARVFKSLNAEVIGALRPDVASRRGDGVAYFDIMVFVIHIELEKDICRLKDWPFRIGQVASSGTWLHSLNPQAGWTELEIADFSEIHTAVNEMMLSIQKYALPYFDSHATLEAIYNDVQGKLHSFIWHADYQIPVMLKLLGRNSEAMDFAHKRLEIWQVHEHAAAQDYCAYLRRFISEG